MWSNLPFDLLLHIFSHLSPESLARANATCRNWHATTEPAAILAALRRLHPPWFVALPMRSGRLSCYAHNPVEHNWIELPLHHTTSIKPIATVSGLIIFKLTNTTSLNLARCNPFTNQFRPLPPLNVARTNPAVGAVENSSNLNLGFKIYVAGGMSEAVGGAAAPAYQATVEMYDSYSNEWEIIGAMPVEFAVRLTVWSPNESVYSKGTLYWMTSARVYSVMGFDISSNRWRDLSVPMADRLDFAGLVPRKGKLGVVGGECGGDARVWELGEGDVWKYVGKVPVELGVRLLGEKLQWGSVKCVGIEGGVCLYKDVGSGVIIWREEEEGGGGGGWGWIEGCCAIRGREVRSFPDKGLLLQPNLAHSTF